MTLEELNAVMREKGAEVVVAINDGKGDKVIKALKKAAKDAESAYNAEVARLQYIAWRDEGNPMETAIRERNIPNGKKLYYKTTDTGRTYLEVNDYQFKVDLLELENAIGVEHFHEGDWFVKIQKLAYLLANALNKQLSNNADFRYEVEQAAMEFDFGEGADFTSDASILKALQITVDSILFMPIRNKAGIEVNRIKVIKPAWTCIAQSMTKQGSKPGEVAISGGNKMCELVTDVIHCIITGKKFKLVSAS